MSRYTDQFGDWDPPLDVTEVIKRAYGLGVAERLGDRHPEELGRLTAAVDSAYERSIVSLSYEEGKRVAGGRPDETDDDVWESLVAGEGVVAAPDRFVDGDSDEPTRPGRADRHGSDRASPDAPPPIGAVDPPDREPDVVEFPSFLFGP
jgi:hypothetical protein